MGFLLALIFTGLSLSGCSTLPSARIVHDGIIGDERAGVHYETSTVLALGDRLMIASDKPVPGKDPRSHLDRSSVFTVGLAGDIPDGEIRYFQPKVFKDAQKFEASALTTDGRYVLLSTGFDRMSEPGAKKDWSGFNTLLYWPIGQESAARVVRSGSKKQTKASVSLRSAFAHALADPENPDGPAYFKVEGMAALPGSLIFGIRESGESYKSFRYGMTLVEAPFEIQQGVFLFTGDFRKIYPSAAAESGIAQALPGISGLGVSSVEYDPVKRRLLLLTSVEKGETIDDLAAYLWLLPLEDLRAGKPPTLVRDAHGAALDLIHKAEGVTRLPDGRLLIVYDNDRATGVARRYSGAIHSDRAGEIFYTVLELSGD